MSYLARPAETEIGQECIEYRKTNHCREPLPNLRGRENQTASWDIVLVCDEESGKRCEGAMEVEMLVEH